MREIIRREYIDKISAWKDKHFIKIITGIRRSGKSTILKQYINTLSTDNKIIYLDFNDKRLASIGWRGLIDLVEKQSDRKKQNYVFLDEVQEIEFFEKAIITLFEHKKIKYDLYITGSNAHMFSEQMATYFTGRNVIIRVFPFSYKEIKNSVFKDVSKYKTLSHYLLYGGLGVVINDYKNIDTVKLILTNVYNETIQKDILMRHKIRNKNALIRLAQFACKTTGKKTSANSISKYLKGNNDIETSRNTIIKYYDWLCESLILHRIKYYDVKSKTALTTKSKYYAGDIGLINSQLWREIKSNQGIRAENVVYLELLKRDYKVFTWADRDEKCEIDFVVEKDNQITYIQVCWELSDNNYERESRGLLKQKDGFPKLIICYENNASFRNDGIKIIDLIDWLLEDNK